VISFIQIFVVINTPKAQAPLGLLLNAS